MVKQYYKLTNPQNSIWQTCQVFPNTSIGNICGTVFIDEKIDFSALEKSINKFIEKNDSFRLKIVINGDGPKQYVSNFVPFNIEVKKIESVEDVSKLEKALVSCPFSVVDNLLFTFVMFEFPNGEGGFIMNAHHLIVDAWTVGTALNGIIEHYEYFTDKRKDVSESYPSYVDFINSEKEYLESEKYNKDKEYWENAFKQIPECATITGSKQSISNSCEAKRMEFNVSKKYVEKINEYCKENKASLYTFFMAVYGLYINRVSALDDFTIGTPILNRTNFKEKHTTGMFVSTVPFKYNIKSDISFSEYLTYITTTSLGMLRHQKYPYSHLLAGLRETDSSIPNLYDVAISYQNIRSNKQTAKVKYHTKWNFNNCLADNLNVHIYDTDDTGSLDIAYDYRTSIYSENDISMLHKRILNLIEQIIEEQNTKLSELEIVTPDEKNSILHEFNNTKLDYPKGKTIVELFENQVEKTPNNIAVVFENKQLTYEELNKKVNSLAHYLTKTGVKQYDIVPVMIDRSADLIISMLAIIKIGAVYLPISPEVPEERASYIIRNSKANYVLSQKDHQWGNAKTVVITNVDYSKYNNNNLNVAIDNKDNLYIIYTSGTTGNPKGVKVSHNNLVNFVYSFNFIYGNITDEDRLLASTNISFDVSIFECFMALLNGASLYLYEEPNISNIFDYCKNIISNEITFAYIAPNILDLVYNVLSKEKDVKLNKLLLGVEPIPSNIIKKYYSLNPNFKIVNAYGPTETTICATAILLNKDILNSYDIVPIGKPLNNLNILILDKFMKLAPVGVPGEIYIAGDNVSNGYLNNEELTAKSFVSIPTLGIDRAYKTGDIAKWDYDGIISFIGRNDNQVKINGHRIELGEIEALIAKFPTIKKVTVIKQTINKRDCLCAYYISEEKDITNNLKKYLSGYLPKYMMPSYYVALDNFPCTANGKIDRKKLPLPEIIMENKEIVLPRNEIDSKLIDIFKNVLGINAISIDDSFFDLGGDSLTAINLCAQIQNEFKVQIYVKDILDNPEVKSISDIISKNVNVLSNAVITPVAKADSYPISSAQKRIYFASKVAGNSSTPYNLPGGVIFEGNLNIEKLEKSIKTLINRHEALRTYFEVHEGNVVQKVLGNIDFQLDIISGQNFDDLNTIFMNFVKPFDLTKAPLFRAKLLSFSNGKYALFIDMHHIISDGTSMSILVDELCKLYNDEELPELKITYKDYSAFENEMISSGIMQEAEKYWMHQFEGEIPVLNLPTQSPRPAVQSFEGRKIYSSIDIKTMDKINRLSQTLGVTPYMLMLGAYYVLLSKYTSSDDIIVGTPIVGRTIADTYSLIGMFVNTLALRATIDSQKSFKEFILKLKDNLLDCYKYQTYPFDELVNKLNIKRDTSRNPLFDTMFIYQNSGFKDVQFNNVKTQYYIPDTNISKFDLSLEIVPNQNGAKLSFEYATELFNQQFITDMSYHYINILNSILENFDTKISEIDMLSKEEKDKILYGFNDAKLDYPRNKTISDLIENQVEKTPDNIAVIFQDQQLTYRELNEKANSLAHYLRENGVGRNDLVGIMANRSLEMIVAILAVLKSGAAYIPIDPTYPKDRIKYMLENSSAKLLLTQKHLADSIEFSNKVCVDLSNELVYSLCEDNLTHINEPEDLSYVIYTSGSTGLPKGVALKHKALSNLTAYCNDYVEYLAKPTYTAIVSITTISFDIFIFETLISLQKGLKLVIANENEQTTPKLLNKLVVKHNIQAIQATPSRMQIFLDNINDFPAFSNLKYITLAGEQLPLSLVNKIHSLGMATIYNGYGPSETTVFSSLTKMNDELITIGKPLPNTQIYILDRNLKPVPIGAVGEIYISGDGVGKGYINNEVLTNKSFIANPFIPDAVMYKSGDMGRYTPTGDILCLGRLDNQVKIRGLRIELGEIEALISKYPDIGKVIVIKQTINNRDCLSAYYVSSRSISINDLRKYLEKHLPKYMVPSYFVALDEMPYTPNGKIDRKALPLPSDVLKLNETEYVAPQTQLQEELVDVFERILNTKPIGINDNFFELGGDSLLAMNLNLELQKISGDISYSDIFHFSTVADLEERIKSKNTSELLLKKIDNLSDSYLEILNNSTKRDKIKEYTPKNVLITGCTGFLGIHILREFIEHENGNIYCIVREQPGLTARARLHQKLNYYFGNKYDDLLDKRIFAITGDITEPGFGLNQEQLLVLANSTDIVINSAARVAHFGNYNDFYNSNVTSVKYMIDFCKTFNKKFYHISTISVGGLKMDLSYPSNKKKQKIEFDESSFYIGQSLDNVYANTKFKAEQYILEAMAEGLDAHIFRMGHLMPRYSDGVFQENILNNAVTNRIMSLVKIGIVPENLLENPLEFTPVDCAAKAIYKLIKHSTNKNRVFILINHNTIPALKLIRIARKMNLPITVLPTEEFSKEIKHILNDEKRKHVLKYLMTDFDKNFHLNYNTGIKIKSDFTIKYLKKLHFKWPKISRRYLINFTNLLMGVIENDKNK